MKNYFKIVLRDLKLITSSVVSIIVILGLCIIPCLYAWFNILSNWDPYEPEATGRIHVAVANDDKGTDMLGLKINVGEKITEALKSNKDIGWVFKKNSKDALEGVRQSRYYAAIIVPESFTKDIMSFITGDLSHPEIKYVENEKKNAIAPKITSKAKAALQKEVDATFIQTLGKYASEAQSVANKAELDPKKVMSDLSDQMDKLASDLETSIVIMQAASGLTEASNELLKASDALLGSTGKALDISKDLLDKAAKKVPKTKSKSKSVTDAIRKEAKTISSDLSSLYSELSEIKNDMNAFNKFVEEDLDARIKLLKDMKKSVDKVEKKLTDLGLTGLAEKFRRISDDLQKIIDVLGKMEKANKTTWSATQTSLNTILSDIDSARQDASSAGKSISDNIDGKVDKAVTNAREAISSIRSSLTGAYGDLSTLSKGLKGCENSLSSLKSGLGETAATLASMKTGCIALAKMFDKLKKSDAMKDVNNLLSDNTEVIAQHLATPIKMKTKVFYPVKNFGSVMTPFYTVLAQWIGALLSVVIISVSVRRRKGLDNLKLHERFFGRYRLFLGVGLAQALIVSLGELLYLGIQCHHPVLFVLAACINGFTFTMINYAVVFAFDNIGLAINVIILVMQVAGSGGTFPVEVLPPVFQFLYPIMPFHYAMDAMRECVAGMYDHTYIKCILALLVFAAVAAILGMLLHRPMLRLNRLIAQGREDSDVML